MSKFETGQRVLLEKSKDSKFTFYVQVNDEKAIVKENDLFLREVNLSDIKPATEEDTRPKYDTLSDININAKKHTDYFFLNKDGKDVELGWFKGIGTNVDSDRYGVFVKFPDEYIIVSEQTIEEYEVTKKRP